MDLLSRDDLTELAEQPRTVTVSLYLPTPRREPGRLAGLIRRAEHELARDGLDTRDILAPAHALAADTAFWRRAADGVAVFLRAGWSRVFRLPLVFDELAVVSDRCHVLPLLPLLAGDGRYFLLALGEDEARLLTGTGRGLTAVPVPDMRRRFRDEVAALDRAVSDVLRGHDAPLVLAGLEHSRAAYRAVATYQHVPRTGVPGCPDGVPAADLHRRAWPAVADAFTRARTEAAAACTAAIGTPLATDDLAVAVAAAKAGRVTTLFLPTAPGDHDEVAAVAVATIRSGGTVYVVPAEDVPGSGQVAVVMRR
jgi:hypothetical protein